MDTEPKAFRNFRFQKLRRLTFSISALNTLNDGCWATSVVKRTASYWAGQKASQEDAVAYWWWREIKIDSFPWLRKLLTHPFMGSCGRAFFIWTLSWQRHRQLTPPVLLTITIISKRFFLLLPQFSFLSHLDPWISTYSFFPLLFLLFFLLPNRVASLRIEWRMRWSHQCKRRGRKKDRIGEEDQVLDWQ